MTQEELDSALLEAVKAKKTETARELIQQKANVNTKDPNSWMDASLIFDVKNPLEDTAASTNNTPLHYAVINQDQATADLLISSKASVNSLNSRGRTPLFHAVEINDIEMVKFLLQKGATVDYQDKFDGTVLKANKELENIPGINLETVRSIRSLLQNTLRVESAMEASFNRFSNFSHHRQSDVLPKTPSTLPEPRH